jgi:nicotinamide mononucleotide transporter
MMKRLLRFDFIVFALVTGALMLVYENQWFGQYSPTSHLEVLAVTTTALCVWLAAKNDILTWPAGLVGTGLYLYLFFDWQLYADAGLQVVYIILGVLGWVAWTRRRQELKPEAQHVSLLHLAGVLACVGIGTLVMREYLIEINGAAPFWDAFLTAGSLGAQYLLIRKYYENWFMWMALDVAYIGLFISREFYLTAGLYCVLLVTCIMAAVEWRKYLPKNPRQLSLTKQETEAFLTQTQGQSIT